MADRSWCKTCQMWTDHTQKDHDEANGEVVSHCAGCPQSADTTYIARASAGGCPGCGHEQEIAELKADITAKEDTIFALGGEVEKWKAMAGGLVLDLGMAQGQWGEDYLWKKWNLSESLAKYDAMVKADG
jgi:hypothetical protein